MSSIGAALPPHLLAKRKRQLEDASTKEPSNTSTETSVVKTLQEQDVQAKKARVAGPALPPAPLEQMPISRADKSVTDEADDADDSDSSDDFGPAAPSSAAAHDNGPTPAANAALSDIAEEEPKLRRDEWMTMPPTQDGLASRMDPTKQRPKGFNTGKGAKAPNTDSEGGSSWHETPEQKRIRLQNEMMGVSTTPASGKQATRSVQEQQNVKIKKQLEKHNGPSLMDMHKESKNLAEVEDDPSKRAFDREKDMGSGARISASQKRQMVSKAADFSRFSGGSYL